MKEIYDIDIIIFHNSNWYSYGSIDEDSLFTSVIQQAVLQVLACLLVWKDDSVQYPVLYKKQLFKKKKQK